MSRTRSIALGAAGVAVLLGWFAGWAPDAFVGWPLLAGIVVLPAGLVAKGAWASKLAPRQRQTVPALALLGVVVAAWEPAALLGPGGELLSRDVVSPEEAVPVPSIGEGQAEYRVYFHGVPASMGPRRPWGTRCP